MPSLRYASVFIFLTFTAIFLSFSRGAYVGSGIYLVGSLLVMHKADKLRIVLSALAALVLVVVCCPKEVQTTLAMNRTASQRQSTESRVHQRLGLLSRYARWRGMVTGTICMHLIQLRGRTARNRLLQCRRIRWRGYWWRRELLEHNFMSYFCSP